MSAFYLLNLVMTKMSFFLMCNLETKEVDLEIAQPVNFYTNICKQNIKKLHLLFVNAHTKNVSR